MEKVLCEVGEGKARDQPTESSGASGGIWDKSKHGIMKEDSQSSGALSGTSHGGERRENDSLLGKQKSDKDDEKARLLDNKNEGEQDS